MMIAPKTPIASVSGFIDLSTSPEERMASRSWEVVPGGEEADDLLLQGTDTVVVVVQSESVDVVRVELVAFDQCSGACRSEERVGDEVVDIIMNHRVIVEHHDPDELGFKSLSWPDRGRA